MLLLNKSCLKSYCYGAFCDLKPNKLNISFMYLYISHQCWLSRAIFFPLEIWLNYFSIGFHVCPRMINLSFWICFLQYQLDVIMQEDHGSPKGDLLADFGDALLEQRPNCMSGFGLTALRENRYRSHIQHRLTKLEG